jgi:UDP-4-amino-4,6-dideoxy-N-acetyl-beta-L-altrosamine N-acetyltransferase
MPTDGSIDSLRHMNIGDLERVLEWRNHPQVREFMFTRHEITMAEHAAWFARNAEQPGRKLLIFDCDGVSSGFANLSKSSSGETWSWGFYLAPSAPRGTGRKLGSAILKFAFLDMKIHKLCAQVLAENERSIRFHLALGFLQEGLLRQEHFDGSSYHDVLCFGLLRDTWRKEGGTE